MSNMTRQSISSRQSLFGAQIKLNGGELLPGSSNPFVVKVRSGSRVAGDALNNAGSAHSMAVQYQLAAVLEARSNGHHNPMDSLMEYAQRSIVESEQRMVLSTIEASSHDLQALQAELAVHHELTEEERDVLSARISLDLEKCAAEKRLLGSASSLSDLPADFVNSLLDLQEHGIALDAYENTLSPMHIATQLGRRDVLEYLLSLSGGEEMLAVRDAQGRTPLYHAQNNKALHAWLVEEHRSSGTAMHQEQRRPSEVSQIPEKYMPLLQQIEKEGWKSVHLEEQPHHVALGSQAWLLGLVSLLYPFGC